MCPHPAEYPELEINPAIKGFFKEFYDLSDDPQAHDAYTDSFTDDATLIMGSKSTKNKGS